jgi:hypothetical protein
MGRDMKKAKSQKYWVMLARPVIETVIVEVTAVSDEDAGDKARKKAAKFSEIEWEGEFQKDDYGLDVVACLPHDDLGSDERPEKIVSGIGKDHRYMLLKADVEFGDGTLLVEPWLGRCNPVVIADYLGDWSEAIHDLYEASVGEMYDWIEQRREEPDKQRPTKAASAKVIFLGPYLEKKRSKNSGNDE